HTHGGDLPPIANEWPTTSYQNVSILARQSFSIFAPSNAALNDFFQRYWRIGGYSSLSDVDRLAMQYLLLQFYYSGSIVFPEEITQGMVMNRYGTVFNFNPYTASDKALCVNGSFFGLSDIGTPPLFGSVAGPAFRDKNKMAFLYALSGSQMLDAYASNNIQFTLLVPSDALLLKNGIQLNSYAGRKVLEIETEDGLSSLSTERMQEMANMHTSSIAGGLATTGKQVVPSQISFNYWYLKDGTISSSANFNNYLNPEYTGNPFVPFTEITNNGAAWNNGRAYTYSDAATGMLEPDKSDGLAYALAVGNDNRYLYSNFVKLLKCAGLVNGTSITFLAGSQRFIAFIPTNEAIEQAVIAKQIPGFENCSTLADWDDDGIDKDIPLLATYLKSYFILATNNVFTNYPYPGSSVRSGVYISGNGSTRMQYSDTGTTLNVKSTNRTNNPNVVATYDYFPFAFKDGCFHLIDATL
ncbi:MAG: fasciclin, partial [Paludibacter sp.]|nr:fasciclin [Paludibacter sp.]